VYYYYYYYYYYFYYYYYYYCLTVCYSNNTIAISNLDKSNLLAQHFASVSAYSNYNKQFLKKKTRIENKNKIIIHENTNC